MKEDNAKKKLPLKRFYDIEAGEGIDLDHYVMDNLMTAEVGGMQSENLERSGEEILKEVLQNKE